MSVSLSMKFALSSGDTRTISLSNGVLDTIRYGTDSSGNAVDSAALVQAAADTIIENGGAFEDSPTELLSAKINESSTTVLIDNE